MKNARPTEVKASAPNKRDFIGTDNPRHLRALVALMLRPRTREELDREAGCSNGPQLISDLRDRGLNLPCDRVPCIDRDGRDVKRGVYSATSDDQRAVRSWLRRRDACKEPKPHQMRLDDGDGAPA